jgi:hypothetical protein
MKKYTLTETAALLRMSSAWINKAERFLGIKPLNSCKGKSVSYTETQINILKKCKLLRVLNFPFCNIKKILANISEYKDEINKRIDSIKENISSFYEGIKQ